MSSLKKLNTEGNITTSEPMNLEALAKQSGNLYLSCAIISQRARQIGVKLKEELHGKLEEFATSTDNLEEVFENREQIEISRFYEKLPNPSILATREFIEDEIYYRLRDEEPQEEKE